MKVYLNLRKDTEKPFAGRTKEGKELRHDHRDRQVEKSAESYILQHEFRSVKGDSSL